MPDIKRSYETVGAGDGESQPSSRSASPERQRSQRSEAGNGEMTKTLKRYRRDAGLMSPHQESEWQSRASSSHRGEESPEQHEYPTMWRGGSSGGSGGDDWYSSNQGYQDHDGNQSLNGSDSDSDTASQHREGEKTIEEFQKNYDTQIDQSGSLFYVYTKAKDGTEKYENSIDIDEGKITGCTNARDKVNHKWHFSDIVYMQLRLVLQKANMDISQFDLKRWYSDMIVNEKTKEEALLILQRRKEVLLERDSEEFNRLLNTPTQKSKKYLLDDHPEDFPGKQLRRMKINRWGNTISIDNEYG